MINNISIIIPSLNPDDKIIQVVEGLICEGFSDIIIVNDGSDKAHQFRFNQLMNYEECTIITHNVNMGKGRALKDAFTYVLENRLDCLGVVTVDGDNQHKAEDVLKCSEKMIEMENSIVLGCRDFSTDDVPNKSKFGNEITSTIFKKICGINISDTQTGLRAIPFQYLTTMLDVKGERFEYETNMLLQLKTDHIPFTEVKIQTVYINDNETTHFRPIIDSFKIYKNIFMYSMSSLLSSIIDISVFTVFNSFILFNLADSSRLLFSTVIARIISSIFNFCLNRNRVFKSSGNLYKSLIKYYLLCIVQMLFSYGLVLLIERVLLLNSGLTSIAKIVVDVFLFFISYKVQQKWVFKN